MKKNLGVLLAGLLLAGGTAVALAQQAPSPGSSQPPMPMPTKPTPARDFIVLHTEGVAMKRDGTKVDVRMQKGIIDSAGATSITLTSPDGYKQTFAMDSQTVVKKKRQSATAGDLKAGDMARVVALKSGSGYTAKLVNSAGQPGPRLKKMLDAQRGA